MVKREEVRGLARSCLSAAYTTNGALHWHVFDGHVEHLYPHARRSSNVSSASVRRVQKADNQAVRILGSEQVP